MQNFHFKMKIHLLTEYVKLYSDVTVNIMNILEWNRTSHSVITCNLCQYKVSRCFCQGFRVQDGVRDEACAVANKSAELERSQSEDRSWLRKTTIQWQGTPINIATMVFTKQRKPNNIDCGCGWSFTRYIAPHQVTTVYYLVNVSVIVLFVRVRTLPMTRCHSLKGTLYYIKIHVFLDYLSMVGFTWPFRWNPDPWIWHDHWISWISLTKQIHYYLPLCWGRVLRRGDVLGP